MNEIEVLKERKMCDLCADSSDTNCFSCAKVKGATAKEIERAFDLAIAALQKQIPASPTAPQQGYRRCPSCNAGFIEELGTTNYCGNCGQALKWEDD